MSSPHLCVIDPLSATIDALIQAERRSGSPMFAAVYSGLAKYLSRAKSEGKTLAKIAEDLSAAVAEPASKGEPVSLVAVRKVVQAFRQGVPATTFV
jgi:hypothetical protein